MKSLQIWTTIACTVFGCIGHAQDSTVKNDGPYVFYNAGHIESIWIDNGTVQKKDIDPAGDRTINISFSAHPDWNFSVAIRKKLLNEACVYKQPGKAFFVSDIEGEF